MNAKGWLVWLLGIAAVACSISFEPAAGAPPLRVPLNTPITPERIELGKKLFFDPRLSFDGTVSCSTCHDPNMGWADHNSVAVGVQGRTGTRNSPTIINAAYSTLMFHDGRTIGMPTQSLQPIVNRLEMGGQTESQVLRRIAAIPGYQALFIAAYGPQSLTSIQRMRNAYGHAIASFESTLVSFDAPVDKRLLGLPALSPAAEVGFQIFAQSNCMSCHKPPLFTDLQFHNNGMEFASKTQTTDRGRAGVLRNGQAGTERAFKTATLREIHRTFPYSHTGAFTNLEAVVRHYNLGGATVKNGVMVRDRLQDPRVRPLNLTSAQESYLVTFLREAFASPNYPFMLPPRLP